MKKIRGTFTVELTLEDAVLVNALLDRDSAKPAIDIGYSAICKCPACGENIGMSASFCDKCGQRIDTENFAVGGDKIGKESA